MKLLSIKLENFRQFYGKHTIDFSTSDNGITVISGNNGRGKTSIYRALIYGLYGEKMLSQDEGVKGREINLVNISSVEEKGKSRASVEISFKHSDKLYRLRRGLISIKNDDGNYSEQEDSSYLDITDSGGKTERINDEEEVLKITNRIIDQRVKDYFLFDGEKIEKLMRVSQKKEVAKGLRNLLDIDKLETSLEALRKLEKILTDQLKSKSTGEYQKYLISRSQLQSDQDVLRKDIADLNSQCEINDEELNQLEVKLQAFHELKILLDERQRIEDEIKRDENALLGLMDKIIETNEKSSIVLMEHVIEEVYWDLKNQVDKGMLPPAIRQEVIKKSLDEHKCYLCGSVVEDGSEAYKILKGWQKEGINTKLETSMIEFFSNIKSVKSNIINIKGEIRECLQNYSVITQKIERLKEKLEKISEQIGGGGGKEDIRKFEEMRRENLKRRTNYQGRISSKEEELKRKINEYNSIDQEIKKLEVQKIQNDELVKRSRIAIDTKEAFTEIIQEFTHEIKDTISQKASNLFLELIGEDYKSTFAGIKIEDDFSLEILDLYNHPYLGNISQGQRQILSLSFIMALAQLAGKATDILEVPLFMDTPFGRLDDEHRKNLITAIPKYTSQWILLATDTEISKKEAGYLDNGNWDKAYVLVPDGRNTIIKEFPISKFINRLGN